MYADSSLVDENDDTSVPPVQVTPTQKNKTLENVYEGLSVLDHGQKLVQKIVRAAENCEHHGNSYYK